MEVLNNFLVGFIASLIGVIPPGLLNLSAAKIRMQEGASRAYLFSIGVSITVIGQTAIGLLLAGYLTKYPEYLVILKRFAATVFFLLSIYFLFLAKDTRIKIPKENRSSHANRFFAGLLLAAVNLFPFPYWVYIGITFSNFNVIEFSLLPFITTIIASGLGTYTTLVLYIKYFKEERSSRIQNLNLNWIIGGITGLIAILTLFQLLN